MRFKHFELGYCSNMHPGDTWLEIFTNLQQYIPSVKQEVSPNQPFGFGLRLSYQASTEVLYPHNLEVFKRWLQSNDLYVFTINGFVYGDFYRNHIKQQVYLPYWHQIERKCFTQNLIRLLVEISQPGDDVGISISPLAYKFDNSLPISQETLMQESARQLVELAAELFNIHQTRNIYIHLDIEPEPDCFIETADEVITFFKTYLLPRSTDLVNGELAHQKNAVEEIIKKYITVCFDICHFAVNYEDSVSAIKKMNDQGISIGKVQISAALSADIDNENREIVLNDLKKYCEPIYLHQTRCLLGNEIRAYPDLDQALVAIKSLDESCMLRSHFHVPIFQESFGHLNSTQQEIISCLHFLKKTSFTKHLEVETYTWAILPYSLLLSVTQSVSREINWVIDQLID